MPPTSSPGSTTALRSANLGRVVDLLRSGHVLTQAELSRQTGLAPATVSSIVRDLAAAGLVTTEPGAGRRGTTVGIAASAGVVAGIDVGHSHVSVAVGALTGPLLAERRTPLAHDHPAEVGITVAQGLLAEVCDDAGVAPSTLRTFGLGLPAPMTEGVVQSSAILPGWVGVNAPEVARQRFGTAVHVENDANLGALAEHRNGVARGHRSSVFVKVSTGVGAGIVLDGQLLHGSGGTAGEVGHLTIDENGPVCRCGSRGCLEAYASGGALQAMLQDQLPDATVQDIVVAANAGHVSALRALEDAGLHLGWALASVVNLLNPGLVVVGGDLARAGDLLLGPARIGLRRHALDAVASTPVEASQLGERASLVGAVLLAAERTDLLSG
jgi:predicted NBD/HSP70 family sugar kinase